MDFNTLRVLFVIGCSFVFSVFIVLLMRPLWKLAQDRIALFIILSKEVTTLVKLCCVMVVNTLVLSVPGFSLSLVMSLVTGLFLTNVQYVHVLALALNRAHGALMPFHYMQRVDKRFVLLQCIACYLVAAVWTVLSQLGGTSGVSVFQYVIWVCILLTIVMYTAVAARIAWFNYQKRSWTGGSEVPAAEKDQVKICIACSSSLINAAYTTYILCNTVGSYAYCAPHMAIYKPPFFSTQIGQLSTTLFSQITNVTEELCLLALSRDFRKAFVAQFTSLTSPTGNSGSLTMGASGAAPAGQRNGPSIGIRCVNVSRVAPNGNGTTSRRI